MSLLVGKGEGPQVDKFEQVSSDDHKMSVPGGRVSRFHVWGGGGVSRSHVQGGGGTYHVTYLMTWIPYE